MSRRFALVLMLAVLPPLAAAQKLALKPGGWEVTTKSNVSGKVDTATSKSCVKAADLEGLDAFMKPTEGCKREVKTRTSTRLVMANTCSGGGMSARGEIDITVQSPESARVVMTGEMAVGGKTETMRIEATARWRQASCEGYDEE